MYYVLCPCSHLSGHNLPVLFRPYHSDPPVPVYPTHCSGSCCSIGCLIVWFVLYLSTVYYRLVYHDLASALLGICTYSISLSPLSRTVVYSLVYTLVLLLRY